MAEPKKLHSAADIRTLADAAIGNLVAAKERLVGPSYAQMVLAIEQLAEGLKLAADRIEDLQKKGRD